MRTHVESVEDVQFDRVPEQKSIVAEARLSIISLVGFDVPISGIEPISRDWGTFRVAMLGLLMNKEAGSCPVN